MLGCNLITREGAKVKPLTVEQLIQNSELEEKLNAKAYEMLKSDILAKHQGRYVAIAEGRLLAVSSDFDQALAKIKEFAPDAKHYLVFKAGEEPGLVAFRE